jgi:antitoxin PrlF
MTRMRITSKGRVTIPKKIRDQIGFLPGTEIRFIATRYGVELVKATLARSTTTGAEIVRRLRGTATVHMSTNEILALTRK